MNWKEDYAKEAMQDGRHAARSGETTNPHPAGTRLYRAWEQGCEGVLEDIEKKEKEDARATHKS